MRILVVGGTRFVGRHLVAEASRRGHELTVLHRGAGCPGAPGIEHLHADRDGDLRVLAGRTWDATVDTCAYWPAQVESLADALAGRGGRHLFVSTVSVYADPPGPGRVENAPCHAPLGLDGSRPRVEPDTYGPLKVGCELAVGRRHADLLIVRPTYVLGPHDHTGRFGYWVARVARGGRVLVPGVPEAPVQQVDARDLGAFCVRLLESGATGPFHAMVPPPFTWAALMAALAAEVGPPGTRFEWVGSDWLSEEGVTPAQLPLWTGTDEPEHVLAMDPARALAAGLHLRPLAETIRDVAQWLPADGSGVLRTALTPAHEAELLDRWDRRER